jgi:hypothetical protein
MLRWCHNSVENPPAETTPDFVYKPCKDSEETVIGESQKEEEAGLALCTFPAPYSCVCSRGPRTPILTGENEGQPRSLQMGKTYQRQHSAREICTPLMFVAYVK